jgi:hypothetical protein
MTFAFARIEAGRVVGRRVKLDGSRYLVVENAAGAPVAVVGARPVSIPPRPGLDTNATTLEAADGLWLVPYGPAPLLVFDAAGREESRVEHVSATVRALLLPTGPLTWSRHALRPQYRIDDAYAVNRAPLHSFVPGFSRKVFTGEITPALAARPDASLALLLAAWLTRRAIDQKVAVQNMNAGSN